MTFGYNDICDINICEFKRDLGVIWGHYIKLLRNINISIYHAWLDEFQWYFDT